MQRTRANHTSPAFRFGQKSFGKGLHEKKIGRNVPCLCFWLRLHSVSAVLNNLYIQGGFGISAAALVSRNCSHFSEKNNFPSSPKSMHKYGRFYSHCHVVVPSVVETPMACSESFGKLQRLNLTWILSTLKIPSTSDFHCPLGCQNAEKICNSNR